MKISEVIDELNALREQHGDLPVLLEDSEWEVSHAEFNNDDGPAILLG